MLDLPYDSFIWWQDKLVKLHAKRSAETMNLTLVAVAEAMGSKDAGKIRKKISKEAFSG